MAPRRLPPAPGRAPDEAAVTDVLGSILLVGITVVMAVGLGGLLLTFDGPADTQHSRLAATIAPGSGGWGTADEQLRVTHLGGEPVDADEVRILVRGPTGAVTRLSGAALGGAFADGQLSIGETWVRLIDAELNDEYSVQVLVDGGDVSQQVAASRILAGSQGGPLCLGDTTPPVASFQQAPADVTSLTPGAVTVSVTVADGCAGVDESVAPRLFYCVAVTCVVPTSYTDAGAMADTGTRTWSGNVPAQPWLTHAAAGRSLRYYVAGMEDLNDNVGNSGVQTDVVDLLVVYTYVASANAVTGTVSTTAPLANAQQAPDGVEADLVEGAVAGSPTTVGPTRYSGAAVANAGAVNPNNALAADDARVEFDSTGDAIEVSGFDLPADASTVSAVVIGYEGRKAGSGGTSPTARIDYRIGAGTYQLGTSFTEGATVDTDRTRTLTGTVTTVAQVETMAVRIVYGTDTNRNLQVDRVFATVTYATAASTNHRMDVELEWTGVPSGVLQTVELQHRASGDSFTVQAWNFATLAWRTCAGSLSAASSTTFTCTLAAAEVSAGEVRLRVADATPAGTAQGHLYLDSARVATA